MDASAGMNRDPYGQNYYQDVQSFAMTDIKLSNPGNLLDIYIKKQPLGKAAKQDSTSKHKAAMQVMDGAGDCQQQTEISPSEPFEGPQPEESAKAGSLVRERVKKLEECAALANKKAEVVVSAKMRAKSVQPRTNIRPTEANEGSAETRVTRSEAGKSMKATRSFSLTDISAKHKVSVHAHVRKTRT